jgi:catechol 2,3-dioxygenase-like lactoylglutathione lyase family enzyme
VLSLAVEINHIVIPARDHRASAELLAQVLGAEAPHQSANPAKISADCGVTIEFAPADDSVTLQCAILVDKREFDAIIARMAEASIRFYSGLDRAGCGEVNHIHGGRGIYFDDLDGHVFEIIEQVDAIADGGFARAVAIKLISGSGTRHRNPSPILLSP